jgi:hypothetical protein
MNRILRSSAIVNQILDGADRALRTMVNVCLPDSEDGPPFLLKQPAGLAVAPAVRFDLLNPISRIAAGSELSGQSLPMSAVPKISVTKYRDPLSRKNNIRLSWQGPYVLSVA